MSFEDALKAELSQTTKLKSKVFPLNARMGIVPPFLVFVSTEGVRDKTLKGYLTTKEVSVELNILSTTYQEMKEITRLVLDKIISFQERTIGESGIFIQEVSYSSPTELYENELKSYRSLLEVTFKFKEE